MPRWVLVVAGIVAVIWLITDPSGAAAFVKQIFTSIITFAKGIS